MMQWVAISGSRHHTQGQVEADVRQDVSRILARGDGIITGGAWGVDHIATDEALKHSPACEQLKVIIPTPLDYYAAHYLNAATKGLIAPTEAHALLAQLGHVKRTNRNALIEMPHTKCNTETYYERNSAILAMARQLYAYQVNSSPGTQDTIDKARAARMAIMHQRYTVS